MNKNENTVATTQESQTTQKVYKVPTGKFVSLEEKKKRKEAREQEYQNFRINALKRRAKRMGLNEEDTNKAVETLKKQLSTPNMYNILLLFNPDNINMIKEALKNEDISYKIISGNYAYIEGDQEVLDSIRSIVPPGTKVHPYVKKKPSVLQAQDPPKKEKKPKNRASVRAAAKAARKARKAANIENAKNRKKNQGKAWAKAQKQIRLLAAKKAHKATTVQLKANKRSTGFKKASTTLKKAA